MVMASTTTLASPQDSDAWALLALKEATAIPAKQKESAPCDNVSDSVNADGESISVSASVDNNPQHPEGGTDSDSPVNLFDKYHPHLQFIERDTGGKVNGHLKAPIAKLKGKDFEFLVRQDRLVIGRNSSTKGRYLLISTILDHSTMGGTKRQLGTIFFSIYVYVLRRS